jgi:membrane fusion protein, copper/silver efflux system
MRRFLPVPFAAVAGTLTAVLLVAGLSLTFASKAAAQETRKPLYYRNPMGLSDTSPVPKKDYMGMNYIPVYEEEGDAATTPAPKDEARKVLYYRHPMGLPETSPVPKKDAMGMDFIPVYDEKAAPPPG